MKRNTIESKKQPTVENDGFEILSSEECAAAPALGQDSAALLVQLEADLVAQLKVLI